MGGFVAGVLARIGMAVAEAILVRLAWELYSYVRSRRAAAAAA
ncbi:hypothetical protein [Streptomyces sp. NPDC059786]